MINYQSKLLCTRIFVILLIGDYTPDRFKDEIRGLAEGASVSEKDVIRLNMLPELIKAGCSMFGAWGNVFP